MASRTDMETDADLDQLPNVHPGEILEEEFLKPMGLSHYRIARDIGVSQRRIDEIVAGRRAVTAETALLLARYFGTSARLWLNLQASYDLEEAERHPITSAKIERVSPLPAQPAKAA